MADIKYRQEKWSLADLFPAFDAPEVEEALVRVDNLIQENEAFRSHLSPVLDVTEFMRMLQAYERLVREFSRLHSFSGLSFAADTQDQQAQSYLARSQQLAAEAENRTLFFQLWWKELDDEPAERLLASAGDYRYWLEAMRRERPYTLSEAEERVINLKDVNGSAALTILHSTITDHFTFRLEVEGEEEILTFDELRAYYYHPDPDLRAAAFQELLHVYEKEQLTLGQIYQYRVRDWHNENVNLRGYESPISVRNLSNDLPDGVVDILLTVCQENVSLFQRYFRLKAKWLGMKKLRRYDLYAPVTKTEKRYAFDEAVGLVLDSFRRFEPRVAELAERVFAEHHLDSEIRKGKQGGAFCATVTPGLTPWILQSYQGRPADVATMAHELGHAIHSMLAEHHTALTQQASLPLSETASTFSEMLVVDRLLTDDPDPETHRDLLFRQMDSNYATILRQAFFAIFERDAHQLIHEGATIDDLSELYAQNIDDQFGDALQIAEEFRLEWLTIPHLYQVPFYVYAYAFGQLLVLSLYQQYLEEGEGFKPRYLALLTAGGSDSPSQILKRAGIEIEAVDFWQGGFGLLQSALEQLEAIELPEGLES